MKPTSENNWIDIALFLVILTIIYNVIEAVISIWSGLAANSIALLGFGFDSIIEFLAAGILIWRLLKEKNGADKEELERVEHRTLQFVGITFFILAAYVLFEASSTLFHQEAPKESLLGIIIAVLSLIIMPILAWFKLKAADHIGSAALRAEAKETIACTYLSFTLLLGLTLNATLQWWWADPTVALFMVPWLIKEGMEGLNGEGCCS